MNKPGTALHSSPIPMWLLQDSQQQNTVPVKQHLNTGFIRRTLAEVSRIIQNDFLTEKYARQSGLLQGIHPAVKLTTFMFYMVFSSLTQQLLTLVFLAVIGGAMGWLSGLRFGSMVKRVWLILPLITLILSFPAATNIFIKGQPLIIFYHQAGFDALLPDFPKSLYITSTGILMIVKMSLRIGVSISFGYVLAMTTPWTAITRSLRIFKLPRLAVMLLDMTYRFIFVLSKVAIEMFEARLLRTVGKISGRENRRFVSNGIASLFLKANHLGDEIFSAMICRGYTGEPVTSQPFKFSKNDILWLINHLLITLILLAGEFIYA
ncbi:MAG: cobalt ECF transporter T component CbiQ [Clostridia bacterium]|nr:cobalt ECF transporter T component CbiQ [Clostridia bacterium]